MPRAVRNVQYLPSDGWTPVVVTPRDAAWEPKDPSSLGLLPPALEVIRTDSVEAGHFRPAVGRLRSLLPPRLSARPNATPGSGIAGVGTAATGRAGLIRQRLFFPDDQVGWVPFAVRAALKAHRSNPFDAVFSTSFPVSAHLVAGTFKRLTGVPWVAEFRDPWVGNVLPVPLPWMQRRLQIKLERWIVRTADRVVCVTPRLARMYQERYPGARNRGHPERLRSERGAPGRSPSADRQAIPDRLHGDALSAHRAGGLPGRTGPPVGPSAGDRRASRDRLVWSHGRFVPSGHRPIPGGRTIDRGGPGRRLRATPRGPGSRCGCRCRVGAAGRRTGYGSLRWRQAL